MTTGAGGCAAGSCAAGQRRARVEASDFGAFGRRASDEGGLGFGVWSLRLGLRACRV